MTVDKTSPTIGAPAASGAVRGASLLIMLQIASRAVTFIANQLLLRFLTAQLLGISTQLEVYYLSVLFFARESLRVAIQRQGGSGSSSNDAGGVDPKEAGHRHAAYSRRQARDTQAAVNLSYISILLGILVAALLGWLYLASVSPQTLSSAPNLTLSLYIYAAASVVELLSEPAFVVMQTRLRFGTRAAAESVATFARCAVALGSAVVASRRGLEVGVLPVALGQLSYGVALLGVYLWQGLALAGQEGFSLLPMRLGPVVETATAKAGEAERRKDGRGEGSGDYALSYFYRPTLSLARSMIAQSLVKHVLTQGDTFLVSALSTPTAQGIYALANNYGGLAARLVFQPVEESSRSYFSRLLSQPTTAPDQDGSKGPGKQDNKEPPKNDAAQRASKDLTVLLKLYTILSVVVVTLGPTAAPLLISLVAGPRWASSGAGAVLAVYALYIPLLAVNGVAEAFVASVATEAEVHVQSLWMGAFSLAFGAAGFVFLRLWGWGAEGLVAANGINMVCRIVWCTGFISRYFRRIGVRFDMAELRPSALTVGAAVVASQIAGRIAKPAASEVIMKHILIDLVKIAGLAMVFIATVAFGERDFLLQCFEKARGRGRARAS